MSGYKVYDALPADVGREGWKVNSSILVAERLVAKCVLREKDVVMVLVERPNEPKILVCGIYLHNENTSEVNVGLISKVSEQVHKFREKERDGLVLVAGDLNMSFD